MKAWNGCSSSMKRTSKKRCAKRALTRAKSCETDDCGCTDDSCCLENEIWFLSYCFEISTKSAVAAAFQSQNFQRLVTAPWMDRPWELYFLPRGFWITLQLINLWSSPPGRRIGVWSLSEANPGFVTARKFTLKNQPNSKTIFKTYCKIYLLSSTPLSSNLHLLPNHNQFTPHFFSTTHQFPLWSLLSLAPCRAS